MGRDILKGYGVGSETGMEMVDVGKEEGEMRLAWQ